MIAEEVEPACLMGRDYIRKLIDDTKSRFGVPGGADVEMLIQCLEHLGARTLAIGTFFTPNTVETSGASAPTGPPAAPVKIA